LITLTLATPTSKPFGQSGHTQSICFRGVVHPEQREKTTSVQQNKPNGRPSVKATIKQIGFPTLKNRLFSFFGCIKD
jgi:hypothetical protein